MRIGVGEALTSVGVRVGLGSGVGACIGVGTGVGAALGVVVLLRMNVGVVVVSPAHAARVRTDTTEIARKRDLFTGGPSPILIILVLPTKLGNYPLTSSSCHPSLQGGTPRRHRPPNQSLNFSIAC